MIRQEPISNDELRRLPDVSAQQENLEMSERNSRQIWQDIVSLTDQSDSDIVRSLRIALLVLLGESANKPLWRQTLRLLLNNAPLLNLKKARLPRVTEGQLVFFFVANDRLVMNHMLPVALEADRRGLLGGIVGLDAVPDIPEFAGRIPMVTVNSLVSNLKFKQRTEVAAKSRIVFEEMSKMFSENNGNYAERFRENNLVILDYITTSIRAAMAFQVLYDAWRPSCVVSPSDLWPIHYQFSNQAASMRIPSVTIQHGISNFCSWPFVSELCCVWGEDFAEEMFRIGTPSGRLAVSGLPSTDRMFRQSKPAHYWQERGRSQPVCLFLSQTHGTESEPLIFATYKQLISNVVRRMPLITWKVKLHPMEDDSFYRGLDKDVFSRLTFHPKETSLEEAVADADVVSTTYSTSGLEAMIMGRPLIIGPALPRVQELAWWPAAGGGVYAESAEDFETQLTNLVSDRPRWTKHLEQQHSFLKKSFANQGHAAQCVVDVLERYSRRGAAGAEKMDDSASVSSVSLQS